MSTVLHVQTRPQTKVEQYFRLLYGQYMREIPRQRIRRKNTVPFSYDQERPWVYVGSKHNMKPAATFYTLFSILFDDSFDSTYYTPNSFYRNDGRRAENARWINAITVDIDVKPYQEVTLQDVLDRAEEAGLPMPTLVVQTPSGGFHVTWVLDHSVQPVRATWKTVRLFEAIQKHVAEDMGADPMAIGVERIFRTPTEENICFFQPVTYAFQTFIDWRDINHPYVPTFVRPSFESYNIMDEPAIRRLYNQDAEIGKRDATCFTLALAMKFSGYPLQEAMLEMAKWWHECCEKGAEPGKKPFTLNDALQKVKYVYNRSHLHGPSVEDVERLTGMSFSYRYASYRFFSPKKPREERQRVHTYEWKADLLEVLKSQGTLTGSLAEIAKTIGCAVSTLKIVLNELKREGVIDVQSKRGRNGSTTIQLREDRQEDGRSERSKTPEKALNIPGEKNSQSHNTGGEVVGGASLEGIIHNPSDLLGALRILNAPYPASLPQYLTKVFEATVLSWYVREDLSQDEACAAAAHTYAVIKKTLMSCLRSTKRKEIKNLTAYVRKAIEGALSDFKERGYWVNEFPSSWNLNDDDDTFS